MNSAIIVVLVLLSGVDCRPARQDVLAGEDFLAFFMRSHRPRSQHAYLTPTTTTTSTTAATTESTTFQTETESAPTTLETEPPSVVSVRVSSSVRKEAVHEVPNALAAAVQTSHFSVESSGYREVDSEKRLLLEDSVAEATQDFPSAQDDTKNEEKKPYAEALTLEESGLGYESRVSSETSQSRVYFTQPKPVSQSVIVHSSENRKYEPQVVVTQTREERKYVPHLISQNRKNHKYETQEQKYNPQQDVSQTQAIITQTNEERHYSPQPIVSQTQALVSQSREERQFSPQPILSQTLSQSREQQQYNTQPMPQSDDRQYVTKQPVLSQVQQGNYDHQNQAVNQEQQERNYETQEVNQREDRHYEPQEENYEVDESISVMTNGRAHGVQTDRPPSSKFGFVQEGRNYRKYRVEEKTPDGFIVGEYGVVSHDDGGVRGVRYTADGSINPRLIYEALVKFLSLK